MYTHINAHTLRDRRNCKLYEIQREREKERDGEMQNHRATSSGHAVVNVATAKVGGCGYDLWFALFSAHGLHTGYACLKYGLLRFLYDASMELLYGHMYIEFRFLYNTVNLS